MCMYYPHPKFAKVNAGNKQMPQFGKSVFYVANLPDENLAYHLGTKNLLQLRSTNTLTYENDSLSFRGDILWNSSSDSIKSLTTSASFKRSIKKWKGGSCSCKICR